LPSCRLGGAEGVLCRRMSLFCGSFSLEAAESVCEGPDLESMDILDSVSRLVDKSLLILDQSDSGVRYRMLETIREYAFDRLRESSEVVEVQTPFLRFFFTFERRDDTAFFEPRQGEWFRHIGDDTEDF